MECAVAKVDEDFRVHREVIGNSRTFSRCPLSLVPLSVLVCYGGDLSCQRGALAVSAGAAYFVTCKIAASAFVGLHLAYFDCAGLHAALTISRDRWK